MNPIRAQVIVVLSGSGGNGQILPHPSPGPRAWSDESFWKFSLFSIII